MKIFDLHAAARMQWKCTGAKCGKCVDLIGAYQLYGEFELSIVHKYYKVLHSTKKPTLLICKECNRNVEVYDFEKHNSFCKNKAIIAERLNYTTAVVCGTFKGSIVYISYDNIRTKYPQIICLHAADKAAIRSIVDDSWDLQGGCYIKPESDIYERIVKEILKKLIVCYDCGFIYDTVPTADIVARHILKCSVT